MSPLIYDFNLNNNDDECTSSTSSLTLINTNNNNNDDDNGQNNHNNNNNNENNQSITEQTSRNLKNIFSTIRLHRRFNSHSVFAFQTFSLENIN